MFFLYSFFLNKVCLLLFFFGPVDAVGHPLGFFVFCLWRRIRLPPPVLVLMNSSPPARVDTRGSRERCELCSLLRPGRFSGFRKRRRLRRGRNLFHAVDSTVSLCLRGVDGGSRHLVFALKGNLLI